MPRYKVVSYYTAYPTMEEFVEAESPENARELVALRHENWDEYGCVEKVIEEEDAS